MQNPFLKKTHKAEQPLIITRKEHAIDKILISSHVFTITNKLKKAGYTAYVVGGCVRDLLLGVSPKDFDLATDASPTKIEAIFENCRLIGRRFRLAHIYYPNEIIEVSTFRAAETGKKPQHRKHSNCYGACPQEDALQRDFTINGLFYDCQKDIVLDYIDGFSDIKTKTLKIIGNPKTRYQEDPVRMLRLARFVAKLGVIVEPDSEAAIVTSKHLLADIPSARLYEETKKLFSLGHARKSYETLKKYDLFFYLFPALIEVCNDETKKETIEKFFIAALENTDIRHHQGKIINPPFLLAVFLYPAMRAKEKVLLRSEPDELAENIAATEVLLTNSRANKLLRRHASYIRKIWHFQKRLENNTSENEPAIQKNMMFRAAYDFLALRARCSGNSKLAKTTAHWKLVYDNQAVRPVRHFRKRHKFSIT